MNDQGLPQRPYHIIDLNYISLYLTDLPQALAFYSQIFGSPQFSDANQTGYGWQMGATWLTLFSASAAGSPQRNPQNTEFAIQVSALEEVDALYDAFVAAGAQGFMAPQDTSMYEPMRFACIDDPFGVRIDIYCPRVQIPD